MKSNQRHIYGLIILLFVLGASVFLYRHFALDVPLTDTEHVNSWTVEATLKFNALRDKPIKASFYIPYTPPQFAILDEYFVSQNYGVTTNLKNDNRQTVWSQRRAKGPQSLYYRAIFRETDDPILPLSKPSPINKVELSDTKQSAVDSLTKEIRESSADIQTFAQSAINVLNRKDDNARLLIGKKDTEDNIIKAATLILNQANIPAISVKGISMSQAMSSIDFKHLLAIHNGKKWLFINPKTGSTGMPKRFLIWQYGDEPSYELSGGSKPSFNISVTPTPINALTLAKERGERFHSRFIQFSLLQLPVKTQETYKILLMVPVGAFVILLLRNFIGLSTFGTFMPVLIALAFRETNVGFGIFLFVLIVSFGLLIRFYLDQLHLLLVPRLAAILTIVILLMLGLSVLMHSLGITTGLSVALFPMVILTMTIERMCITWDERGAAEAIKNGCGSLLAAVLAYYVMSWPNLQYLFFAFPELLIVLLATILLFGQYRGYRLFELFRFKALGER